MLFSGGIHGAVLSNLDSQASSAVKGVRNVPGSPSSVHSGPTAVRHAAEERMAQFSWSSELSGCLDIRLELITG